MDQKKETIQVTHTWNRSYVPTNGVEKAYLLLELKGTTDLKAERAPINLSLVLDRSGSMYGAPLQYSKDACKFVVNQMGGEDILSLVAFDSEVSTIFSPEKVTHKDLMKQKIDSIDTRGSTNLSGGLIMGAKHVLSQKKDGIVQRVLLLSDGHANQGVTDPKKLAKIAQEYSSMGVGITTMGVGDGFDEELMEAIAESGQGNFYYIEKPDQIPQLFAQELEGLLSVVAQNIRLTIKPVEGAQITGVFGYSAIEKEGQLSLSLGDMFAQEIKSVLVEVTLQAKPVGLHPVFEVEWNYADVTEGIKDCTLQYTIPVEYTNNIELLDQHPNSHVEKQIHITQSAKTIEEALKAFDDGDMELGQQLIKNQAEQLSIMADSLGDAELKEESIKLFEQVVDFSYSSAKRKELHQQKYKQMKRRKG
jgi:Ca-activated chloride channel family protein